MCLEFVGHDIVSVTHEITKYEKSARCMLCQFWRIVFNKMVLERCSSAERWGVTLVVAVPEEKHVVQ